MGIAELVAALGPTALQFLGGLFDSSGSNNLNESKRQFDATLPMRQGESAVNTGDFLSRLLKQKQELQDTQARAAGMGSNAYGAR